MGGINSGRWRDRGARRCEQMHCIDLAERSRNGPLQNYQRGTIHWTRGNKRIGSVTFTVLPQALRLEYQVQRYDEEAWTRMEEDIPFAWTETAFDGRRRWFCCPTCHRRCRAIFGGERFRCRRCYRLTYQSQYETPHELAQTRAQKVRIKLGGSGSMQDPFPPKPKGMHWRTYGQPNLRGNVRKRPALRRCSNSWVSNPQDPNTKRAATRRRYRQRRSRHIHRHRLARIGARSPCR